MAKKRRTSLMNVPLGCFYWGAFWNQEKLHHTYNIHLLLSTRVGAIWEEHYDRNIYILSKNHKLFLPFKWAKIWLKYTNFFQIITSDYFQPNLDFFFGESNHISPILDNKGQIIFGQILEIPTIVRRKKNPLKYITFS